MTSCLTLKIPEDLAERLAAAAETSFRTPDQQALWILHRALPEQGARKVRERGNLRVPVTPQARLLLEALRELLKNAGEPSSRQIASRTEISHTTVNEALRGETVPNWKVTRAIVAALGGDPEQFLTAWELAYMGGAGRLNSDDQHRDAGSSS